MPTPGASEIVVTLFPVFSTLVFVAAYAATRKVFRCFFPNLTKKWSMNTTKKSGMHAQKLSLTQFEIASGVELHARYGVVSDYDNYVHIKGMKFASADGVHSSGFVIANGKFLVHTSDLIAILLIKITRLRFKNVYVYEVDGNTVKQTARLVYPETIPYSDMFPLNLRILL